MFFVLCSALFAMKKRIIERSRNIIRIFNILSDNRDIGENLILWSFIKMYSGLDRLKQTAAALTYHTLFAAVPITALIVAVANKMGYGEIFREQVQSLFISNSAISSGLLSFTDSYLNNTNTSHWLGAAISLSVLLYSVFSIFQTIDNSFNSLWNLKGHTLVQQLKVFVFILMLPALLIILLVVGLSVFSYFSDGFLKTANVLLITMAMVVFALFLAYKFIPSTKVEVRYAAISAGACGVALSLVLYFGLMVLETFTNLQNVYGGLASVLLFIIWINASWTICLAGSRWNYFLQEGKRIDLENKFKTVSHNYRKFITVLVLAHASKLFGLFGKFPLQDLVNVMNDKYNLPDHITMGIVDELCHKGMLYGDDYTGNMYYFNTQYSKCNLLRVIDELDTLGDNSHTMQMTSDVHLTGKEGELWQYINEGKCNDVLQFDIPLSHFPE